MNDTQAQTDIPTGKFDRQSRRTRASVLSKNCAKKSEPHLHRIPYFSAKLSAAPLRPSSRSSSILEENRTTILAQSSHSQVTSMPFQTELQDDTNLLITI